MADPLDARAIIAALGGDVLALQVDRNFDDGYGGLGLAGAGDDTVTGTELADVLTGGLVVGTRRKSPDAERLICSAKAPFQCAARESGGFVLFDSDH